MVALKYKTKKEAFEDLLILFKNKGGKLLCNFDQYPGTVKKLSCLCKNGHIWQMSANSLFKGRWCPQCSNTKLSIDEMKNIALLREGYCLSDNYINARTKLDWQCKMKHKWQATPDSIKSGSWCPKCNTYVSEEICRKYMETIFNNYFIKIKPNWLLSPLGYPMELDGYCKELNIAFEHNGPHHYSKKCYNDKKIDFNKIRKYDNLKKKTLESLNIKLIIIPELFSKTKLKDLSLVIKEQCNLLKIDCDISNVSVDIDNLYNKNSINTYYDFAKNKNGFLIKETFINSQIKCKWKCDKGHMWDASPTSVVNQGSWCPICSSKKLTIEIAKQIAINKNGICLSNIYFNSKEKLCWQCNVCQTIWKANLHNIKINNTWCPHCARKERI